jgi:transposase
VRHDLATLEQVVGQLVEMDDELRGLSYAEPWSEVIPYLLHLPDVGLIVAMTVLAAIGDITRFPTSKKLVGYSRLAAACMTVGKPIARVIHLHRACAQRRICTSVVDH